MCIFYVVLSESLVSGRFADCASLFFVFYTSIFLFLYPSWYTNYTTHKVHFLSLYLNVTVSLFRGSDYEFRSSTFHLDAEGVQGVTQSHIYIYRKSQNQMFLRHSSRKSKFVCDRFLSAHKMYGWMKDVFGKRRCEKFRHLTERKFRFWSRFI